MVAGLTDSLREYCRYQDGCKTGLLVQGTGRTVSSWNQRAEPGDGVIT